MNLHKINPQTYLNLAVVKYFRVSQKWENGVADGWIVEAVLINGEHIELSAFDRREDAENWIETEVKK